MYINKRFVSPKTATQLINVDAITRSQLEKALERKEFNSKLFDRALGVIYAMVSDRFLLLSALSLTANIDTV
jgi:capsule polysaccharide export protein KpsC/LpsZ